MHEIAASCNLSSIGGIRQYAKRISRAVTNLGILRGWPYKMIVGIALTCARNSLKYGTEANVHVPSTGAEYTKPWRGQKCGCAVAFTGDGIGLACNTSVEKCVSYKARPGISENVFWLSSQSGLLYITCRSRCRSIEDDVLHLGYVK